MPICGLLEEALIAERITILTEGSATTGFGHIRRSITLANLLIPKTTVRLWVVSKQRNIEPCFQSHFTGLAVGSGPFHDSQSPVEILDLEPEVMRCQLIRAANKTKRVCLDWFDPMLLPDVTMNLFDHGNQMRLAYQKAQREKDYIEGPACAIIRPGLLALRPSAPVEIPQVRHIVISTGGADPAKRTLDALADLKALASKLMQISVVIGPLVPNIYEAEVRQFAPMHSKVLRMPQDYDEILASADLVLCSGGGTLLESMCLGKPTVVYPQTPAEQNHALYHAEAGACVMASSLMEVLNSVDLRKSLVAKAHARVDGLGAIRIAETALNLLQKV